eukprot:symbB.v1.2.001654.t4/scaffold86.1/size363240/13
MGCCAGTTAGSRKRLPEVSWHCGLSCHGLEVEGIPLDRYLDHFTGLNLQEQKEVIGRVVQEAEEPEKISGEKAGVCSRKMARVGLLSWNVGGISDHRKDQGAGLEEAAQAAVADVLQAAVAKIGAADIIVVVIHAWLYAMGFDRSAGRVLLLLCGVCWVWPSTFLIHRPDVPPTNPVGIPNLIWTWRGCQVRYQVLGEKNTGPSVLMLHGLLAGLRVYALDLLGNGYTDKLDPTSEEVRNINGETKRDLSDVETNLVLGGGSRKKVSVPQGHPLGSVYNIFTWSEQVTDFIEEMIQSEVILIGNSLGSLVSLQAAIDRPEQIQGLLLVNPRFRQEHVAEARGTGHMLAFDGDNYAFFKEAVGKLLYDALKTESSVMEILKEPYYNTSQVTPELVEVLRAPLLMEGALESTLDILSYSTGPLLEQLLEDDRLMAPVWVCWGQRDPWTPLPRVMGLEEFEVVKKLVELLDLNLERDKVSECWPLPTRRIS